MILFKEKERLIRKERRFLGKLKSPKRYLYILSLFVLLFSPVKRFLTSSWKGVKSVFWIISFSIYKFLWFKVWYIDDFIVNSKTRGKWVWTKLFSKTLTKLENDDCDYSLLVSWNKRKTSHRLYKKFWFTVISLWIWILAYKKLKRGQK